MTRERADLWAGKRTLPDDPPVWRVLFVYGRCVP